ncbi:MAG: P-loop NTPase family protein [Desulfobaccales bacterium]
MKALSRWLAPLRPGRAALLWGEPLRPLAAAAAAWGVGRGAPVFVVDAANRFDPYQLVREARIRGLDHQQALSRVRVARAFTSHQLVRLLQEELARELTPGGLALLLGPVSLFYDEQVPLKERRRLFQELVDTLTAIKTRAPILLLQPLLPQAATNRGFGRMLTTLVDVMGNFGEGPGREDRPTGPNPLRLTRGDLQSGRNFT